ncbi:hypothetical protein DFJ74DRAFT_701624 [Hyaloraphidium curvatum]|nr:hypothetical protein DFJ74DRAFT_701624 [Hyaloraphidium curvatum]
MSAPHTLTALVLLVLVAGAASGPVPGAAPDAVFRRSCADCGEGDFCEFAYPGAPADHVACVTQSAPKSLYRRYASAFTACAVDRECSAGTNPGQPESVGSAAACLALCTGSCTVASWDWLGTCRTYDACASWGIMIGGGGLAYVTAPSTCPA